MIARVFHGEGASVMHIIDDTAPDGEQPAIRASFKLGAMKLADLKRLPVGTKLRLTRCLLGECLRERTVAAVHSNAIEMSGPDVKPRADGSPGTSWLYLPKAALFRPVAVDRQVPGFTIMASPDDCIPSEDPLRTIAARYEFITHEEVKPCLRCPATIPAGRVVSLCDACLAKCQPASTEPYYEFGTDRP